MARPGRRPTGGVGGALLAVATLSAGVLVGPTAALGSQAATPSAAPVVQAAAGTSEPVVRLRVPGTLSRGTVLTTLRQLGHADIRTDVVTANGGRLRVGTFRTGENAMDFPAFSWDKDGPRAVVRVRPAGTADPLAPRWADFTFGADFGKDRRSSGHSTDDGDNLIQRGLYGQRSQYKIQVDNARVSCRVKGSAGAVMVGSPVSVRDDRWYRVRCSRAGGRVELVVVEHRSDGSRVRTVTAARGSTGRVAWSNTNTPLSVGGKLTSRGRLTGGSVDQFNGVVYNPLLVIDG